MGKRRKAIKSSVVIAKHLGAGGFSDLVANQVESYWKKCSGLSPRQLRQIHQLEKAIADLAKNLSVTDRLALGRFIGLHKKMSFDTGLRIGLMTFAQREAGGIEVPAYAPGDGPLDGNSD